MNKSRAEKKVKRALAKLDKAVQNWYKVNAPDNTERYATLHIRDYPERGEHVCYLTMDPIADNHYTEIVSPTEKRGD